MLFRKVSLAFCVVIALAANGLVQSCASAAEAPVTIAPPTLDNPKAAGPLQRAVFAGGCFWGVQGVFQHVRGVKNAISGYAGGDRMTAHYEVVGSGMTDHAESVAVTFDPAEISYGELLQVFFSVIHDPTQLNRQGPDTGTQYRSAIFYANEAQQKIATAYIAQLDKAHSFPRAIVTRVDPLKGFYPAESYHQDFLIQNPTHGYIVYNDLPKVRNFKHAFPGIYSEKPVLVAGNKTP
jgi:peptide-methionine (S)-S-oxide reductase